MLPAKLPIVPVALTGRQKSNMSAKARAMYAKITPASQKAFKSFYDDLLDSPLYSGIFGLKKKFITHGDRDEIYEILQRLHYQEQYLNGTLAEKGDLHVDGLRVKGVTDGTKSRHINDEIFEKTDTWKYNANSCMVILDKVHQAEFQRRIAKAFQKFTYFDIENMEVTKSVRAHGQGVVMFNPEGSISAAMNNIAFLVGGLSFTHNVSVFGPHPNGKEDYDQIAITHGGHALVGIRKWGSSILLKSNIAGEQQPMLPNNMVAITIWTQAWETYNNLAGRVGGEAIINSAGIDLWKEYIMETAEGVINEMDKKNFFKLTNKPKAFDSNRKDDTNTWAALFFQNGGIRDLMYDDVKNPFLEDRFEIYHHYDLRQKTFMYEPEKWHEN